MNQSIQEPAAAGIATGFDADNGYTGYNTNHGPDSTDSSDANSHLTTPGIINFHDMLHLFFTDHNNNNSGGGKGIMHITSGDGYTWSQPDPWYTGYTASSGPRPVLYNNVLYLFFRDGSGSGILHIQSTDGISWSPAAHWYIGLNCDGEPAIAVLNDVLCLVALDKGGRGLMYAVQSEANGSWTTGFTGFTTSAPPSIVVFQKAFHVFFRDGGTNGGASVLPSKNGILHITSTDGINWTPVSSWYTGFNSSSGPAPIVYNDVLYVFFRDGSGNGILFIESTDGLSWKPGANWYIGLNCDGQPSITLTPDGKKLCLVCVDAGGDNGIMRSVLSPNFY